jgi:hypothetical protein
MADAASLVAKLGANLDQLGRDFKSADDMADKSVKSIEDKFSQSNPTLGPALDRMKSSAVGQAADIGVAVGVAIGTGVVLAVGAAVEKIHSLIDELSKFGDHADDLRLPVNLIQALSVEADRAARSRFCPEWCAGKVHERIEAERRWRERLLWRPEGYRRKVRFAVQERYDAGGTSAGAVGCVPQYQR